MVYLLVATILVGLWATEDDHSVLDVQIAILVFIIGSLFALVQVVALRHVLAGLLGDLLLVRLAIVGHVGHQETIVSARLVHDLIKLVTAVVALRGLTTIMLLGVGHELTSALAVLLHR